MELRQLRYFVRIVDTGSLTRAAEQLHVAQPSLSQQLANLETDFNARLLIRGPRGVSPTEAGTALYRHAQGILRHADNARFEIQQRTEKPTGRVMVGTQFNIASVLVVPMLARVWDEFPDILVSVIEGVTQRIANMLSNGRIDIGLLYSRDPSQGIATKPILEEELFVVSSATTHALPEEVDIRTLAALPLVLSPQENPQRRIVEEALSDLGLSPKIVGEVEVAATAMKLTRAGMAATIQPWSAVAGDTHVNASRIKGLPMRRTISLAVSDTLPMTTAATAVMDLLPQIIRKLVENENWRGVRILPEAEQ